MRRWVNCKNCNERYSNEMKRCPFCDTLSPLSFLKICATILVIFILIIAIVGIVFVLTEKDHTGEKSELSSSDVSQKITLTESKNSDSSTQNNSELESSNNEITETKKQASNSEPGSNPSTTTSEVESEKNNTTTITKPQEQKPTNQIPEDKINGVKTADIALPIFYDATEGLKHCRDWYRPLSFICLTSGMDEIVTDYNEQFNGDYILEVGGNIDNVMIYRYRIRFDFEVVSDAKAKFEKHLDDNTEFFNSQLALYKEYLSDVTGILVIFEHDESNLTLTSRIFK